MSKKITQETFDDAVKEIIDDFEMSPQEAIEEAIDQFKAQGVNLHNIVTDLLLRSRESGDGEASKHPVIEAVECLAEALKSDDHPAVLQSMKSIQSECDLDLAHRCLAGSNNAYNIVYDTMVKYKNEHETLIQCILTLASLMNGQPDLLDIRGTILLCDLLNKNFSNVDVVIPLVKLVKLCCIMHENNRQCFVQHEIITLEMKCMTTHRTNPDVVTEVCMGLRTLTLDDDIRVPFGKAHEHAQKIVTEADAIKTILEICVEYASDGKVLSELFSTLALLAVRDQFCQEILELGGVSFILKSFEGCIDNARVVKKIVGVLKAVAGNDNVKVAIVSQGGAELIVNAMSKHMANAPLVDISCACLAVICLRQPGHSKHIMGIGTASVIVQAMKVHKNSINVQKQSCSAIRNLVARTREYCQAFLELDAEELINTARAIHGQDREFADIAQSALRDLGCKVELQELWKGERGQLQS